MFAHLHSKIALFASNEMDTAEIMFTIYFLSSNATRILVPKLFAFVTFPLVSWVRSGA